MGSRQERGGGRARSSRLRRGNSLWRAAFAIVDEIDVLVNVEAIVERMLLGEQLRRSSWIGMILNELLDVESRVSTKFGEVRGYTCLVGGMFDFVQTAKRFVENIAVAVLNCTGNVGGSAGFYVGFGVFGVSGNGSNLRDHVLEGRRKGGMRGGDGGNEDGAHGFAVQAVLFADIQSRGSLASRRLAFVRSTEPKM